VLEETGDDQEIIARVAALDIGKAELVCCTRLPSSSGSGHRVQEVTTYSTMTRSLQVMVDRLLELGVTRVVMEATSDYWKSPFYLLEAHGFEVWLVNAKDVKHLPGRPKTDRLDAAHNAERPSTCVTTLTNCSAPPRRTTPADLSGLPAGRRRMLAETGRRSTNQALQRADVDRRHPILLATLAETYVEVLDELVQLLDQALAGADSRARHELSERVVDRARTELERGRLLDEVLDVLADPAVPDDQVGRLIRARIGMPRLQVARRPAEDREPRDHGHFDLLAARYKYSRTFTPPVIAALPLTGEHVQPRRGGTTGRRRGAATAEQLQPLDGAGRGHQRGRDLVCADPLARLSGHHPGAGPGSGVSAQLGTERAARSAGPAAFGRRLGTGLAPLHRPDHPAHPC